MRTVPFVLVTVFASVASTVSARAFSAQFSWMDIRACEKISPEFELSAVPSGTKRLRFEMHDLDVPAFHHGGATVPYDTNTVKQGAIAYIGPCPPNGEHHRYRWTIQALGAANEVLGKTTVTRTFPP